MVVFGLPLWLSGKESACSAGDAGGTGSTPEWGRSPGEGNDKPFQYSCLENAIDRGALEATVKWGSKRVRHYLGTKQQQGVYYLMYM